MQNKKSLLQRMLVIYIIFFIILLVGIMHSFVPNFMKGYEQGTKLGNNIISSWESEEPRQIFVLGEVPLSQPIEYKIAGIDSLSSTKISATVQRITLTVNKPAKVGVEGLGLIFRSIGESRLLYALTMLTMLLSIVVIILMFIIIKSIRRSIKEEETLDSRNIWYIRSIGMLAIAAELSQDFTNWSLKIRASELLTNSGVVIDTSFTVSYTTIILSILIIFTAEVFAIGQNLSEEQKLTI